MEGVSRCDLRAKSCEVQRQQNCWTAQKAIKGQGAQHWPLTLLKLKMSKTGHDQRRRMINAMRTGRPDAPDGPGLPATEPQDPWILFRRGNTDSWL